MNIHQVMIQDRVRTESYMKSIVDNSHLFKGRTAMDIGAGTGILSLFCS